MTKATSASASLQESPTPFPPGIDGKRSTCEATGQAVILCVEDDRECALLMWEELEERGYAVVVAYDGRQGLSLLRSRRIDLVLCDVNMPQMSGLELLDELNKSMEGARAPFVFITGLDDPESEIAGRRLGADDYVKKPVDFDMLHAIIEARLARIGLPSA